MPTKTMTFTGELTVTSCWCGIRVAIPSSLFDMAYNHGHKVYCPLGHIFMWTETEEDRLRKQLESSQRATIIERNMHAEAEYRAEREHRSAAAYRGHLTRLRNRIANGVCPVPECRRHFDNVQAHIQGQHPDWAAEHADVLK